MCVTNGVWVCMSVSILLQQRPMEGTGGKANKQATLLSSRGAVMGHPWATAPRQKKRSLTCCCLVLGVAVGYDSDRGAHLLESLCY